MEIFFDSWDLDLLEDAARGQPVPLPWLPFQRQDGSLASLSRSKQLESLDTLPNLQLYPHQKKAILQVIEQMRGRAILADEVGLGKTIEAGVILREYIHRGLVERALILTPPSLVSQLQSELQEKLHLSFAVPQLPHGWSKEVKVIVSLDTAKRVEHSAEIQSIFWDIVIIDEAHRLKNRATLAWRFVNQIQKTYLLLLTATPIQNDLRELYNLVTLLWPGKLQTYTQFKQAFMLDRYTPKNVGELRRRLGEVLVRSTRKATELQFPERQVSTIFVNPSLEEYDAYTLLWRKLHQAYLNLLTEEKNILPMVVLLRELCSSPRAASVTLARLIANKQYKYISYEDAKEISGLLQNMPSSKLEYLPGIIGGDGEKAIIFTEFRCTQEEIVKSLKEKDLQVVTYHGGLSGITKDRVIDTFRQNAQILVSTEAGGEGRNLQFCRRVINYDLPWNPMRLEQRIGRVHRLGQTQDVQIVNLVLQKTIEVHILYLLEKKIRMFKQVVGELDLILPVTGRSLEMELAHALLGSNSETVLTRRIEALGTELWASRCRYEKVRELNCAILDGDIQSGIPLPAARGSGQ